MLLRPYTGRGGINTISPLFLRAASFLLPHPVFLRPTAAYGKRLGALTYFYKKIA